MRGSVPKGARTRCRATRAVGAFRFPATWQARVGGSTRPLNRETLQTLARSLRRGTGGVGECVTIEICDEDGQVQATTWVVATDSSGPGPLSPSVRHVNHPLAHRRVRLLDLRWLALLASNPGLVRFLHVSELPEGYGSWATELAQGTDPDRVRTCAVSELFSQLSPTDQSYQLDRVLTGPLVIRDWSAPPGLEERRVQLGLLVPFPHLTLDGVHAPGFEIRCDPQEEERYPWRHTSLHVRASTLRSLQVRAPRPSRSPGLPDAPRWHLDVSGSRLDRLGLFDTRFELSDRWFRVSSDTELGTLGVVGARLSASCFPSGLPRIRDTLALDGVVVSGLELDGHRVPRVLCHGWETVWRDCRLHRVMVTVRPSFGPHDPQLRYGYRATEPGPNSEFGRMLSTSVSWSGSCELSEVRLMSELPSDRVPAAIQRSWGRFSALNPDIRDGGSGYAPHEVVRIPQDERTFWPAPIGHMPIRPHSTSNLFFLEDPGPGFRLTEAFAQDTMFGPGFANHPGVTDSTFVRCSFFVPPEVDPDQARQGLLERGNRLYGCVFLRPGDPIPDPLA